MPRRALGGIFAALLAASIAAPAGPAWANNRSDQPLVLSPTTPVVELKYPELVGRYPGTIRVKFPAIGPFYVGPFKIGPVSTFEQVVEPSQARSTARCRQVTYCDFIPLEIRGVTDQDLFQAIITLTWPGGEIKDGKQENNLDIYIYQEVFVHNTYEDAEKDADRTKEDLSTDFTLIGFGNTDAYPEVIPLGDLRPSDCSPTCKHAHDAFVPLAPPAKMPLAGNNLGGDSGVSCPSQVMDPRNAYKHTYGSLPSHIQRYLPGEVPGGIESSIPGEAQLIQQVACPKIVESLEFVRYYIVVVNLSGLGLPGYTLKGQFIKHTIENPADLGLLRRRLEFPTGPISSGRSPFADLGPDAQAALEPVKVPGPDGPLVDMELFALKGQTSEPPRKSRVPLVAFAGAFVGIGGLTFLTFLFRRRLLGTPK